LRTEKAKLSQPPVIETSPPINVASVRPRKTSISRMSSREKICLHEREKHPPPALTSSPAEDEDEEGVQTQHGTQGQAQASSSSSSEEEEDESESDAESEKAKTREIINNFNNKRNSSSPHTTSMATSTSGNTVKKQDPGKPPAPEASPSSAPGAAPGSWRTSLRKAGSSVTLGPSGTTDPSQESTRGAPESGLGMIRSASSPRLSSDTSTDTKEPRTARVNPIPTRRLFSIPDSNPDSTSSSSCGRRLDDPTVTSTTGTGSSFSAGLSRLNILVAQRLAQEQAEKKKEQCSVTSNSVTTTTGGDLETKQRRKSYLTPVRDEEAEAQRKARSRHARQSRRSTQGVTLTDLQEADKTMKTAQTDAGREKTRKEEEEEAANKKRAEEG
uniref:protein phosphatase 1 regulatory subunit 12A-like n=1 Tax=Oncorhynchus gorbuscha TaxID=8017 RepID=UPI001EAECF9B